MIPIVSTAIQRTRRRLLKRAGPSSGPAIGLVSVSGIALPLPLVGYRGPALVSLAAALLQHQHPVCAEALVADPDDQVADRGPQGEAVVRGLQRPLRRAVGGAG